MIKVLTLRMQCELEKKKKSKNVICSFFLKQRIPVLVFLCLIVYADTFVELKNK